MRAAALPGDRPEDVQAGLTAAGIEIVEGPVGRTNAAGDRCTSIYVRDLDGNLVELVAPDAPA